MQYVHSSDRLSTRSFIYFVKIIFRVLLRNYKVIFVLNITYKEYNTMLPKTQRVSTIYMHIFRV